VLMQALSHVIPLRVSAPGQGTMNNICVGGSDAGDGASWTIYETVGGGSGGRHGADGVDGVQVNMTNTMNTPIESIESSLPIRFLRYRLRGGSGGPGRWRGGCGIERSWMLLARSATLSILADRTITGPPGLFGGRSGTPGEFMLERPSGEMVKLGSKSTTRIFSGEIVHIRTPGGGGYGDPMDRTPGEVLRDVTRELVSLESALDEYGVIIEADAVNREATRVLREERFLGSSG